MNTGKDPFTGEIFVKTRRNQVYASRASQIKFNNQKAFEKRKVQLAMNERLQRNANILDHILGEKDENMVTKDYLLGAGFDFECITHLKKVGQLTFYCIYQYGYSLKNQNNFIIIRIEL